MMRVGTAATAQKLSFIWETMQRGAERLVDL